MRTPEQSVLTAAPLEWSHAVQEIPQAGLKIERTATDAEREGVARELGISACIRLEARYEVRPLSSGRYMLAGAVGADVVQSCVVSLEPVESTLKEAFEVEFWPPDQLPEGALGDLDPLEKTEIEPLQNTRVPAGRIIYEHIAAGLDPYPRAKDASFAWSEPEAAASETAGKGPFDVLKQLKPKT